MKIKTIAMMLLGTTLLVSSCKKKGCTDSNAENYDSKAKKDDGSCTYANTNGNNHSQVTTYIVNDTVDFSTTGTSYDWSVRLTRTGIDTTQNNISDYYVFNSLDSSSGFFSNNRKIELSAVYGAFLHTSYTNSNTQLLQVAQYNIGDEINGNGDGGSIDNGSASARILEDSIASSFQQNSIQYAGLNFVEGNQHYFGWVKFKTLNNNYSCIVLSYSVANDPNTPVIISE